MRLGRYWRMFSIALVACAAFGAVILLFAPWLAGVFLLAIYCIPANSVLPIPHEPAVMFFAKYYDPAWIALAGTIGTVAVSFADYGLIEAAMRNPRIGGAREARLYRWAVRWMMRFPFLIIVLFSLVPVLPIYVVRLLAPASGYPVHRYIAAQIVGRFPRFYGLAWVGHSIDLPHWVLGLMFVILLAFFWLASRKSGSAGLDDNDACDEHALEVPDLRAAPAPVAAPTPSSSAGGTARPTARTR